jgi:hypothetical protein
MDADKLRAIRRRRIVFGAHLLLFALVRLGVGSPPVMPRNTVYEGYFAWGVLLFIHWLFVAFFDARDRAALTFGWLNRLVMPRERRWLLLIIDVMLWFIAQAWASGVLIPYYYISRYETEVITARALQTLVTLAHLGLVVYAELHDRAGTTKRKNDARAKSAQLQADDGELVDFPGIEDAQPRQQVGRK